jgi:hypothetical protein
MNSLASLRKPISAILVAFALCGGPALAQAPSQALDPAALAAARDVMQAVDLHAQMRALGPSLARALDQQMRQQFTDAKMPDGLQGQVSAVLSDFLGNLNSVFTPQLEDQMAVIYARHFKVDELKRLAVVMRDPIVVRFRQEQPNMMSELIPTVLEAMKPQQQAMQAKLKQVITDWFKDHPEDKSKLRNPNAT